ncbi:TolC family protein [Holophaga foetida]|uniref:TolC family protein n=1 Tax=Holophaga foetida TaxID=35839 RepID=UPI00024749CB|nr:TolC family protein [Holophaga foetida]
MLFMPPAQVAEPSAPAPVLNFDLMGALDRAKAENPMLQAAKARVEERRGLITTTRADALPQVNVVADYTRTRDVSILNSGMGAMLQHPEDLVYPRNFFTTQAAISQPLFYWGKLGTAVEVAKMGEREAQFSYTTAELDTLHGVALSYINVLMCQAELEVVQTRLRTAEQFLSDVKSKLEAQTATELDRLRAESEYLAVVPENLQADANHKRAIELLNGQLGLDPKTPLKLAGLGAPDAKTPAGVERSELAQYQQQEAMYQANDKIIKADLRPKVDFNASYGYQANHSNDLFQTPYDTWKVNINMRIPLFDGLRTSGRRSQNRAQLEQVRQARMDKERSIAVEKSTAERELQKAFAFFDAARKAYDASLEALRNSRESYEQGLITSLDLLQAERTERQQESQRRRAELGIWSAIFNHRRALGLPPL